MILNRNIYLGILTTIFMASSAFANPIMVKKFATSPDAQLNLYLPIGADAPHQVFYQGQDGKIQKAMDLYLTTGIPNVEWHGNLAHISGIVGPDLKQDVFVDAKRGVYQVGNMAQFDPVHECLLASDKTGDGLEFLKPYDEKPKQKLDLDGLNVDKDWIYPISAIAAAGENKFLENGDFQFDYFDKTSQRKLTVIKNPCHTEMDSLQALK